MSAMLISPYIPAGTVFQEPKGPYNDSQFDLTSLCSTAKHLFGVPGFLTMRDAWAGAFHTSDHRLRLSEFAAVEVVRRGLQVGPRNK